MLTLNDVSCKVCLVPQLGEEWFQLFGMTDIWDLACLDLGAHLPFGFGANGCEQLPIGGTFVSPMPAGARR